VNASGVALYVLVSFFIVSSGIVVVNDHDGVDEGFDYTQSLLKTSSLGRVVNHRRSIFRSGKIFRTLMIGVMFRRGKKQGDCTLSQP
jgi:hypothetical protein